MRLIMRQFLFWHVLTLVFCSRIVAGPEIPTTEKYDWFTIVGALNKAFDFPVRSSFQYAHGRVEILLTVTSNEMAKGELKKRQAAAPKLAEFIWKHYDDEARVNNVSVVFVDEDRKPAADQYGFLHPKK
jgi:hypothetical protein